MDNYDLVDFDADNGQIPAPDLDDDKPIPFDDSDPLPVQTPPVSRKPLTMGANTPKPQAAHVDRDTPETDNRLAHDPHQTPVAKVLPKKIHRQEDAPRLAASTLLRRRQGMLGNNQLHEPFAGLLVQLGDALPKTL